MVPSEPSELYSTDAELGQLTSSVLAKPAAACCRDHCVSASRRLRSVGIETGILAPSEMMNPSRARSTLVSRTASSGRPSNQPRLLPCSVGNAQTVFLGESKQETFVILATPAPPPPPFQDPQPGRLFPGGRIAEDVVVERMHSVTSLSLTFPNRTTRLLRTGPAGVRARTPLPSHHTADIRSQDVHSMWMQEALAEARKVGQHYRRCLCL